MARPTVNRQNSALPPSGRLADRIVLITGGSRGIGLAIARACGGEGARVVLVARHRRALAQARAQISGEPLAVAADVTRPEQVAAVFRRVRQRYGRLDVLVNNAGVFTYKPFMRTTLADWRANLETNLTSIFFTTREALPLFARSRAPHLINILSVASREAFPNCAAYAASKFGALGLTRVLAAELRSKGIRVTAILPGSTDTRMIAAFGFPVDRSSLLQPDDVAQAVLAALVPPPRVTVEEIVLGPSKGAL